MITVLRLNNMSVTLEKFIELGPSTTVGMINNLMSGTTPVWDVDIQLIIKIHRDEHVEDIQVSQYTAGETDIIL